MFLENVRSQYLTIQAECLAPRRSGLEVPGGRRSGARRDDGGWHELLEIAAREHCSLAATKARGGQGWVLNFIQVRSVRSVVEIVEWRLVQEKVVKTMTTMTQRCYM
mmetsp:Transcript_22417/g.46510  ORF Transcript_22417/g.46510 Transcript_22417/m.46510 type:complete len:107 (+) Transcript_22417:2141-2461(+)